MYVHQILERQIFGTVPPWAHVRQEIDELVDALRLRDWENVREELSDVACFLHLWVWGMLGSPRWSWPAWGAGAALAKFEARMLTWRQIFEEHELEFHPRYLKGGGNYRKPEKVKAALALARAEQAPRP